MANKQSIHEIITDVSNGDVMAFRVLFDAYRDKLYFFLLRIVETKETAEDKKFQCISISDSKKCCNQRITP